MRKGLLEKVTQAQPDVSQLQDRVSDVVDKLAVAHDVLSSTVMRMVVTGVIPAGAAVVIFGGGPGCLLTMPTSANQGSNVGSLLAVANRSTAAVTLKPATGETINGAMAYSIGAGSLAILVSDGAAAWFT